MIETFGPLVHDAKPNGFLFETFFSIDDRNSSEKEKKKTWEKVERKKKLTNKQTNELKRSTQYDDLNSISNDENGWEENRHVEPKDAMNNFMLNCTRDR